MEAGRGSLEAPVVLALRDDGDKVISSECGDT